MIQRGSPKRISISLRCRHRSMPPADLTFGPCCRPRRLSAACSNLAIVVYEFRPSTPGQSRRSASRFLEKTSRLSAGRDFAIGYSPSASIRATSNIGSRRLRKWSPHRMVHRLHMIADVYGSVVKAGIHLAPSIKVAEAARSTRIPARSQYRPYERAVRSLYKLGIDTGDVLAAAATKWNFLNYQPGLVGGHCIGVDPYYLTFRAEKAGYHPEIILAGRRINDSMGERVARECMRALLQGGRANPR